VDIGKAVDVIYLEFSTDFDIVPSGETGCPWFTWVYSSLDKELTG